MDESKQAYPAQAEAQEDASRVEARRQREKKKRENLRFAIELVGLGGRETLSDYDVDAIVKYYDCE